MGKSYVGAPRRIGGPPTGNPGSAPGSKLSGNTLLHCLPFFFSFHSPVLIDAVVAAQTTPGQDAMMEFLDFNEENDITLPERYLLAAAFSTHPSYKLLHDLLVQD